ncbi:hypothetical protein PCL_11775 [Purpureocillium lilacinum]|uniref:Uncharacterized protein n=1 Tax=Purpureocillium lilacinum TaxID=33203 RepID=A0A2U3EB00_PURLI|nr:hypothetical protein Purlil1_6388 [Purpureocillium lilacinum]PWI71681.1 hypothetical protein PCL_11775 [Purpureocillium lilacinum]
MPARGPVSKIVLAAQLGRVFAVAAEERRRVPLAGQPGWYRHDPRCDCKLPYQVVFVESAGAQDGIAIDSTIPEYTAILGVRDWPRRRCAPSRMSIRAVFCAVGHSSVGDDVQSSSRTCRDMCAWCRRVGCGQASSPARPEGPSSRIGGIACETTVDGSAEVGMSAIDGAIETLLIVEERHTASLANCSPKGCMASQNVAWVGIHGDDPRSCRLGTRGMPRLVGSVRIARAHAMDRFDGHGVEVIEVVEVALSSTEGSQSVEEGSHPEGQAGRRAGQGVEGGRVSSAAKDLRSLGQWFGFGLACDGWVGVVGGLLLGLVEGGIASCGWASVGVTMLHQCLQLGAQSRYPVKPAGVDMGIAFGGLSLVKHAQTNRCPMRQADRQSDASMSPLRGPDVVCRRQANAERYSSMYKHRCGYGRGRTLRRRSADGQGADALKLPLVGIEIGCCRNRARTSVDTVMSRSARGASQKDEKRTALEGKTTKEILDVIKRNNDDAGARKRKATRADDEGSMYSYEGLAAAAAAAAAAATATRTTFTRRGGDSRWTAPGVLALAWYRQVDPGQWAGCSIAGRWRACTGVFGLVRLGEVVVTAGQWAEATDDGKTVDEVEELALDESMDAPGQCLPPAGSPPEGCTCLASSILELPCGVPGTTAQLGRATGSCSLPSLSKLGPAEPAMMRYKGTRNVASGPLKVQSRDAPGLGVDVLRHRHPRYPQHRTRPAEIYAQRAQPA